MPLQTSKSASPDLFDLQSSAATRKTPESFLGSNAALVNLDSLVTKPAQPAPVSNPFLAGGMCDLYLLHVLSVVSFYRIYGSDAVNATKDLGCSIFLSSEFLRKTIDVTV